LQPPGLLRLVSALSIVAVAGVTVYAVFRTLGSIGIGDVDKASAPYVSILDFLLPLGIAYTVFANN
jgi:hypothetical protein